MEGCFFWWVYLLTVHVDMGYKREALFFSKGANSVFERVHKKDYRDNNSYSGAFAFIEWQQRHQTPCIQTMCF